MQQTQTYKIGLVQAEDAVMKPLIREAVSYFVKKFGYCRMPALNNTGGVVVSAFSCLTNSCQPGLLPGNRDRCFTAIFYAEVANVSWPAAEAGTNLLVEGIGILKKYITATQGKVARIASGAILAEFRDAHHALRCAVNVQLATRRWNANHKSAVQLRFRIGISYGGVTSNNGEIYGKAINLATCFEGLAISGGLCISESAREQLGSQSSFMFIPLGKRYLKNSSAPVEAFWIVFNDEQIVDPGLKCMNKRF